MGPRDESEVHRAATPLELLFDLVSVIAIASAAAGLHHAIVEEHYASGVIKFVLAFFAIWWAWMNYTWFASAYDNDDTLFRVLTMLAMSGSLVMAAGIEDFFTSNSLELVVSGFVIMRIAMIALWMRAYLHHPKLKRTALTYVMGLAVVQCYWVALLAADVSTNTAIYALFVLGALFELAVPALAEKHSSTPWHKHHIIERYGLLNIIVLGEALLAVSFAIKSAGETGFNVELVRLSISSLIIAFCLWWLYFSNDNVMQNRRFSQVFAWAYGHFFIYLSGAAVGAGLAAYVDVVSKSLPIDDFVIRITIAVPVSIYLIGLWMIRDRLVLTGPYRWGLLMLAVVICIVGSLGGLEFIAAFLILCISLRRWGKSLVQ
ncbi:MAG TPA: low temperature requirement protein A [Marinagarivorans sp.]